MGKQSVLMGTLCLLLLAACSSTTVTSSWKNPDYSGAIGKVYIVGIDREDINRRIFEDEFSHRLQDYGVTGISSYKDLPDPKHASKELIGERVRKNGADSILITRMVGKRTEEVVNPGRITTYGHPPRRYAPDRYFRYWGSYYDRCCYDMIYEPATITQYQVATIEANLYEAESGTLIWSAQLDTVLDANTQKLIADFAGAVIRKLGQEGVI